MTIDQLQEFEGIMKMDRDVMLRLLSKMGDYREDPLYTKLLIHHEVKEGNMEILSEFLSIRWIQENRPDYEKVAYATMEDLKSEIKANRQKILAMQLPLLGPLLEGFLFGFAGKEFDAIANFNGELVRELKGYTTSFTL